MERLVSKGPWREAVGAAFPPVRSMQKLALLYGFGVGLMAGGAMMLMAFSLGIGVGILAVAPS